MRDMLLPSRKPMRRAPRPPEAPWLVPVSLLLAACVSQIDPAGVADPAAAAGIREREVTVGQGEWAVTGMLTLPPEGRSDGPVPGVVLMHGSGPGTRDGDVGPNKVLRELAWGLSGRGIAVLRYDKRTTAHADRFRALGREASIDEEHTEDGIAAVRLLQDLEEVGPVYVLAASQSTAVAADVANRSGGVEGLVLAGVGARSPLEMIIEQTTYGDSLATARGDTVGAAEAREFRRRAESMLNGTAPDTLTLFRKPAPYWASMDPRRSMEQTAEFLRQGGRLLVVHGGRDYLTTETDIAAWEARLGKEPRATFVRYPELNHLMQPGVGKMTPAEYEMKMEVSREFIDDVARWVTGRID